MDVSGPAGIRMCYGHDKTLCIGTVTIKRMSGRERGIVTVPAYFVVFVLGKFHPCRRKRGIMSETYLHTLPYHTVCEPKRLTEAMVYDINKREMEH